MNKRQNALDWFHETYCLKCDRPRTCCALHPTEELACIMAHILKAIQEK